MFFVRERACGRRVSHCFLVDLMLACRWIPQVRVCTETDVETYCSLGFVLSLSLEVFNSMPPQLTWHQTSAAPDNTAARLAAGRRAISQCQQKADVARLALPGSGNERDELCNTAQMSNSQAQQQQQQWTRRTCANKRQLLADQSHTRVDSGLFCDGGHVERE